MRSASDTAMTVMEGCELRQVWPLTVNFIVICAPGTASNGKGRVRSAPGITTNGYGSAPDTANYG